MWPVSCKLCFQLIKKRNCVSEGQNEQSYRKVLFQCCQRLLNDKIEDNSFQWTSWEEISSSFCLNCFLSAEKLRQVEDKFAKLNKEFANYIQNVSKQILQLRKTVAVSSKRTVSINSGENNPQHSHMCLLCLNLNTTDITSKGNVEESDYVEYKRSVFQCCNIYLTEKVKRDSFKWTYSQNSPSPFCVNCFQLSEKLWNMKESMKTTKTELDHYINLFSSEILTTRVNVLYKKTCVKNNTKWGKKSRIIPVESPKGHSDNDGPDDTECHSPIPSNSSRNHAYMPGDNEDSKIIAKIIKEVEPLDEDYKLFDATEHDLPSPCESHSMAEENDWNSKIDTLSNNDLRLTITNPGISEQIKNSGCRELKVSVERLRLDKNGKVILSYSSKKLLRPRRKAAIAADALLSSTISATDVFLEGATVKSERDMDEQLSDYFKEDCNSEYEGDEVEALEYRKAKRRRQRKPNRHRTEKVLFKCVECHLVFTNSEKLDSHSEETGHANERTFVCTFNKCTRRYYRREDLGSHKLTHCSKLRTCRYCGKISTTFNLHRSHVRVKCPVRWNKPELETDNEIKNQKYNCKSCPAVFSTYLGLYPHKRHHEDPTKFPFQCSECHLFYKSEESLSIHMKLSHDNSYKHCHPCKISFQYVKLLTEHQIEVHGLKTRFPCKRCQKFYADRRDLVLHDKLVHTEELRYAGPPFNCPNTPCRKSFQHEKKLVSHLLICTHHSYTNTDAMIIPQSFQCEECSVIFTSGEELEAHAKESGHGNVKKYLKRQLKSRRLGTVHSNKNSEEEPKDPSKTFSCTLCEKKCYSRSALVKHTLLTHRTEKGYKCNKCPASFKRTNELHSHKIDHTVVGYVQCPTCYRFYKNERVLSQHLQFHAESNNKCCQFCEMTFHYNQLSAHLIKFHGAPAPYKCSHIGCGMTFHRRRSMNSHLEKIHQAKPVHALPPFVCEVCGKSYKQYKTLHIHRINLHGDPNLPKKTNNSGEKQKPKVPLVKVPCEYGCGRLFTENARLIEHIKVVHTKELLYICDICGATLKSKVSLNHHLKIHQGAQYECPTCGRGFVQNYNLKSHIRRVHVENRPLRKSYTKTINGTFKHPTLL